MSAKRSSLLCIILLILSSLSITAVPSPAGIGGWVKDANGSYVVDGTPVYAKNLATDEIAYRNTENGYYAIGISAQTGDNIRVTVYIGADKAEKIITIDLGKPTQWCNLSITSWSSDDGNGGSDADGTGNGDDGTSTPPSSTSSPYADFTWLPLQPSENESVSFVDLSTDDDGDISSWVWSIDERTVEQKNIEYIFTNPGNYLISLTVTDSMNHYDTKQAMLVVTKGNTTANTNDTNFTSVSENVTIVVTMADENNNTLANEKVDVYRNSTLIKTGYSDSSGQCIFSLIPGSYTFKTGGKTKEESFTSDGAVTFLLSSGEPVHGEITESFPWLLVYAIVIVATLAIIFIFVKYYKSGTLWKKNY